GDPGLVSWNTAPQTWAIGEAIEVFLGHSAVSRVAEHVIAQARLTKVLNRLGVFSHLKLT
ncbi:MAG: hypothetical protein R3186_04135, partial [Ruegeria sp.]|nr:hypothetical protein [Ruegeria sp.]